MKTQIVGFNLTVDYDSQPNRLVALMSLFRSVGYVKRGKVSHCVSVSGVRCVRLAAIRFTPTDNTHVSTRVIEEQIALAGYRPGVFGEIYQVGLGLVENIRTILPIRECMPMVAVGTRLLGQYRPKKVVRPLISSRLRDDHIKTSKQVVAAREEAFFILNGIGTSGGAVFSYSGDVETWSLNSYWFLVGL